MILRLLILMLGLLGVCAVRAATLEGRISKVSDGDTVHLVDADGVSHKVRLAKIDAPESKQEWGREAAEMLRGLVGDKMVRIVWDKLDHYRRILGVVYVENAEINLAMVATGNAWHYKAFDSSQAYVEAEKSARESRLGLWAGSNIMSPQEWRRSRKHCQSGKVVTQRD